MSSSMKTILIIGATSGIGESFARRFHAMGKKVIITGRRQDRLSALQRELPGVESRLVDNADLSSLPAKIAEITQSFPELDTVWVNSGLQESFQFSDATTSTDASIAHEVLVNVTAPMVLARLLIPHLLALSGGGGGGGGGTTTTTTEANFMVTSSGLAYVPMGIYPVYCATKAAVHSFLVGLRQQMSGTNVNVIEIVPPYVATDLDANHRSKLAPMPLQEYTDETFKILDGRDAKELKEVAVGFAANGASAWRGSIGKIMEEMGMDG